MGRCSAPWKHFSTTCGQVFGHFKTTSGAPRGRRGLTLRELWGYTLPLSAISGLSQDAVVITFGLSPKASETPLPDCGWTTLQQNCAPASLRPLRRSGHDGLAYAQTPRLHAGLAHLMPRSRPRVRRKTWAARTRARRASGRRRSVGFRRTLGGARAHSRTDAGWVHLSGVAGVGVSVVLLAGGQVYGAGVGNKSARSPQWGPPPI